MHTGCIVDCRWPSFSKFITDIYDSFHFPVGIQNEYIFSCKFTASLHRLSPNVSSKFPSNIKDFTSIKVKSHSQSFLSPWRLNTEFRKYDLGFLSPKNIHTTNCKQQLEKELVKLKIRKNIEVKYFRSTATY